MITGLEQREFTWVISGRLSVSERIGGLVTQAQSLDTIDELVAKLWR